MGKLVLGIIAVIVLQLAFSVYIAYDRPTGSVAPEIAAGKIRENAVEAVVPPGTVEDVDGATVAAVDPDSGSVAVLPRTGWSRIAEARPRGERVLRSSGNASRRRPAAKYAPRPNGYRLAVVRVDSTVQREYFGALVVERRYLTYDGGNKGLSKPGVNRQYFGRMVVETRS